MPSIDSSKNERRERLRAFKTNKSNPVAKHCRAFNKSTVYKDRKKAAKRGYNKHRGRS